jgi:hypothetical protein
MDHFTAMSVAQTELRPWIESRRATGEESLGVQTNGCLSCQFAAIATPMSYSALIRANRALEICLTWIVHSETLDMAETAGYLWKTAPEIKTKQDRHFPRNTNTDQSAQDAESSESQDQSRHQEAL